MSFSFAFDIDAKELDDQLDLASLTLSSTPDNARDDLALSTSVLPHAEVPLSDLLATLPPLLSYTPVRVPVSTSTGSSETVTLLRRDLFDARFQILNQDESAPAVYDKGKQREAPTSDEREEAQFIDESSDLVKGVYEGGLKTWECSLDLVDCLAQRGYHPDHVGDDKVRGTSILEVGCGTAVPTCALFSRLLNEIERAPTPRGEQPKKRTRIHLQDYNDQVLSLITLPNLLLTYARHVILTRAAAVTASAPTPDADDEEAQQQESVAGLPRFEGPGELDVTPEFLEAFEELLEREAIDLEFSHGDWSGMAESVRRPVAASGFDLVVTSETVYSLPSLAPLLDLLEAAAVNGEGNDHERRDHLCLVACKRIYFGVGGGELEFRRRVEERGGQVESVWGEGTGKGKSEGVGRTVLQVRWNDSK